MNEAMTLASRPKDDYAELTCGDNLKMKIAEAEVRLARLKEALQEAERSGLASMKINSIRDMMQY